MSRLWKLEGGPKGPSGGALGVTLRTTFGEEGDFGAEEPGVEEGESAPLEGTWASMVKARVSVGGGGRTWGGGWTGNSGADGESAPDDLQRGGWVTFKVGRAVMIFVTISLAGNGVGIWGAPGVGLVEGELVEAKLSALELEE